VALYALLYELTGSATAVAGIMVVQMLPLAVVSPTAGVIVDRFDRRRIMIVAGACYATLSLARSIWLAAATVVAAHTFGSMLWVASNVLLQMNVPDEFRGRVFAAELMALSVVQSVIAYLTGVGLDTPHISPRVLAVVIGFGLWIPAIVWYRSGKTGTTGPTGTSNLKPRPRSA
jgi:MFS family permease